MATSVPQDGRPGRRRWVSLGGGGLEGSRFRGPPTMGRGGGEAPNDEDRPVSGVWPGPH
jgi:hypothetical protein